MSTNQPHFFNSKTVGRTLKEVAVDVIKTSSVDVLSYWYHSNHDADLYTWVDQRQNVIKQQLSFHGQVVEWNCLEGVKTGFIIEAELDGEQKNQEADNLASETIQFDSKPHQPSVVIAVEILQNINIEAGVLLQLIKNFAEPKDMNDMSPQEFLDRFGLSIKNYQVEDHGFWQILKKSFNSIFKKVA
jgi:hypothetical protein